MALEAAQSAEAARRQISRCEAAFAELGERLRQRPPRFVVTCARGSSDHAASYGKYLIETTLGRAVASVGPFVMGRVPWVPATPLSLSAEESSPQAAASRTDEERIETQVREARAMRPPIGARERGR